MKKSLIFLSVFIITFIAFLDAKDRFAELDKVSANTPSQVEMQQMIDKPDEQMTQDVIQNRNSIETLKEKTKQNDWQMKQNQLDNVDKRRDTIKNQME